MLRDVDTRWNSLALAIERALSLRLAIDSLVTMEEHNRTRSARLKRYHLSRQEWAILEQLWPLLQVFVQATERMSKSRVPLLHEVIPLIDTLSTHLDKYVENEGKTYHPAISSAAARGRKVLDRYYAATDDSIMYRAAMGTSSTSSRSY